MARCASLQMKNDVNPLSEYQYLQQILGCFVYQYLQQILGCFVNKVTTRVGLKSANRPRVNCCRVLKPMSRNIDSR
jgi:hypothetical protein